MNAQFQQIKNRHIFTLAIGYIAFGYLLLSLAQETQLTKNPQDYIYYLLVTASTVGYGDMSPETPLGKWIVALFIIPCGLSLFAVAVGRIAAMAVNFWRSGLLGKRHLMIKEHILILGWHGNRTLHLIDMLLHEERNKRPIVLCVRREMENPQPKDIDFVTTPSFTDPQAMARAGLAQRAALSSITLMTTLLSQLLCFVPAKILKRIFWRILMMKYSVVYSNHIAQMLNVSLLWQ